MKRTIILTVDVPDAKSYGELFARLCSEKHVSDCWASDMSKQAKVVAKEGGGKPSNLSAAEVKVLARILLQTDELAAVK